MLVVELTQAPEDDPQKLTQAPEDDPQKRCAWKAKELMTVGALV